TARTWWGGSPRSERESARGDGQRTRRPGPSPSSYPGAPGDLFAAAEPAVADRGRPGTGSSDRYDYDYSERELREWLERIRDLAERARRPHLFFNNCHAGQAAPNPKMMQEMLRQQKLIR